MDPVANREPSAPTGGESPARLTPISGDERIVSIDILRGVAVLGILAINIFAFGLPLAAYSNPSVYSGSGLNLVTWILVHIVVEQKFLAIFSALFGAGVAVMWQRAEERGRPLGAVYYRRIFWLLLFGAVHGYLLWHGDILFHYAFVGFFLYLFRKRPARSLLRIGAVLVLVTPLLSVAGGALVDYMRSTAHEVEMMQAEGEMPTPEQEELAESWNETRKNLEPTPEEIEEEIRISRDGYAGIVGRRAPLVFMYQTFMSGLFMPWRSGAVMLFGMAFFKLGILSGQRSTGFYKRCVLWGYGIGLPLAALSAWDLIRTEFEPVHMMQVASHLNYFGSLAVALGHMGVVMLVCRSGSLEGIRARLAAVGRMAFSNYILHTVICTTLFYGYGVGLFAHIGRLGLLGVVAAIWALQLWLSPLWLGRFRFGPLEWLWRSLTYARAQPWR
jgi:uncharacterized protein